MRRSCQNCWIEIPPDQNIGSVTADGAYDTRKCHEVIAARNAHAVSPPRKNAKPWKPTSAGASARNEAVNAQRFLGRTLWRRLRRIPPPKPCRNQDALYKTARSIADGQGLRQAGRGDPNPHRRPQSIHGPWRTSHRGRRISSSGKRRRPTLTRFVQRSRAGREGCPEVDQQRLGTQRSEWGFALVSQRVGQCAPA